MPSAALVSGTHCLITLACYIYSYLVSERLLAGIYTQTDTDKSQNRKWLLKMYIKIYICTKQIHLSEYAQQLGTRVISYWSLDFQRERPTNAGRLDHISSGFQEGVNFNSLLKAWMTLTKGQEHSIGRSLLKSNQCLS